MKRIVIIGANDFQNPLIIKAKDMGYETHVFAWKDGSIGEKTADYFYPISIIEKEKILEECQKIKPSAVVTIASDLAMITVNYLARKLGLPCNSEKCTSITTNKYEMRKALLNAGVLTPVFHLVDSEHIPDCSDMTFPVIVKPTDRSGSRGITKLETEEGISEAVKDAVENSFENKAIIEEYLEGNEFSCECISYQGKHHFLAVTQKFTTGSPHFIETGHIEPANLTDQTVETVRNEIFAALDALEITNGASHSEFKIDQNGQIRIIEIGARMGGDCIGSDLVKLSTGYDFVKMVIQCALGEKPEFICESKPKIAAIKFIFSKQDYQNYLKIKKEKPELLHHVSDIEVVEDQEIVDSSTRYGFYIITCDSREEAMEWIQE